MTMQDAVRELLTGLGEDPDREGLADTPKRVAKALKFLTKGYDGDPEKVIGDALFTVKYDEMVIIRDIDVYSLCEHHMLPFFGKAHVAYIPEGQGGGPVQDPPPRGPLRATASGPGAAHGPDRPEDPGVIQPRGVGVVIEAMHFCMIMRGVEKQNSVAATSCMLGAFRDHQPTREEFLGLIRSRNRPGF